MTNYTKQLKLNTDYKKTGNQTGQQIDTLALSVGYVSSDDLYENNMDYIDDVDNNTISSWLDSDAEDIFQQTLSKKQAKLYANDLTIYENALAVFKEEIMEQYHAGNLDDSHLLMIKIQKYRDFAYDSLYKEWLYGDRSECGVIGKANRRYCVDGMELSYDHKKDIVTLGFTSDSIAETFENGDIEKKTQKDFVEWVTSEINGDAIQNHYDKELLASKRREENEKTREYKKVQKERQEQQKRDELLAIANRK